MATLQQIESALRAADAAGNSEDARQLAQAYKEAKAAQTPTQKPFVNSVGRIPKPNPAAANPTEGQSFGTNFWAGAGKSLVDTAQGVSQMVGGSDYLDRQFGGGVDDRRAQDAALMGTGGGFIGNVSGQAAQMAVPVGGSLGFAGRAAPYIGAAIRGGAFAGAQGTGEGESRLGNTAMGATFGAGGQAIASGMGAVARGAKNRLQPEVQKAIEAARAAGIPLHVSQVTNSRFAKTLGSVLNQLPFTGAAKAQQTQQEAFNRAVARSFGSEATTLSDDAMKAAGDNLGDQYTAIFAGKTVGLDRQAFQALANLHTSASGKLESPKADVARKQILRIIDEAGPNNSMTGEVYQSLRSSLKKDFGTKDKLDNFVMDARRILDDSAKRSIGPDAAKMLDKTNSQWANFRTTQDALGQIAGAAGNVRPASLYPLIRKGSTKELRMLAKIGQNVLKDPIPDSGTSTRELVLKGLGGAGGATLAGLTLPAVAKIAGLGALGGRAMNSNSASKLLQQGRPISGLAHLARHSPQVLPALGHSMGAGSRFASIMGAAGASPGRGPEIIANLDPQEQPQAIAQFAQAHRMNPQEVARRVQAERSRLAALSQQ